MPGALFVALTGKNLGFLERFSLTPAVGAWSALFMTLGYALYACLTAGVGALVPDVKASRGASLLIYAPALVGFEINLLTYESPHGALSVAGSLFPLTSPFVIIRRLVVGGMPAWQPVLAAIFIGAAIPLAVLTTSRLFRAQNLLSGQRFSVKRYLRALRG